MKEYNARYATTVAVVPQRTISVHGIAVLSGKHFLHEHRLVSSESSANLVEEAEMTTTVRAALFRFGHAHNCGAKRSLWEIQQFLDDSCVFLGGFNQNISLGGRRLQVVQFLLAKVRLEFWGLPASWKTRSIKGFSLNSK